MKLKLDVYFTPYDFNDSEYPGYSALVIDVLRATTSIATACAHGCECIIPVKTVEEAVQLKTRYPDVLLAGERKGCLIPGFNLGNSPREYTTEQVSGKTIVMTTTNGTLALSKAAAMQTVYTCAFVNVESITRTVYNAKENLVIICAGSEGRFSLEDVLCAGLVAERLSPTAKLSDTALAAQAMYRDFSTDLLRRVTESSHAQYLNNIGFGQDIALCLEQDTLSVVPKFSKGYITA
jgi:2-phosphosulfolactate phosphatase